MKIHFDPKTDAVYLRLDDSKILEPEDITLDPSIEQRNPVL